MPAPSPRKPPTGRFPCLNPHWHTQLLPCSAANDIPISLAGTSSLSPPPRKPTTAVGPSASPHPPSGFARPLSGCFRHLWTKGCAHYVVSTNCQFLRSSRARMRAFCFLLGAGCFRTPTDMAGTSLTLCQQKVVACFQL